MDSYLDRLPPALKKRGDSTQGEIQIVDRSDADSKTGVLYEDKYILLVKDPVRFPNGRLGTYLRVIGTSELTGGGGTVMVPIWHGHVIFIRLFRHATRTWEWELPRGFQEPDLSEEENARQEIQQEIHRPVLKVTRIGETKANTGLLSGAASNFLVEVGDPFVSHESDAEGEGISESRLVPFGEVDRFILGAPVTCGFSLAALFQARLRNLLNSTAA